VDEVHLLMEKYGDKVEWLSIYLMEAHAQDVWPLGQHVCVNKHISLETRIESAQKFVTKYLWKLPMIVDCFESNNFMITYLSHPERFYAFFENKLQFKAQPVDAYFPVNQVADWLESHFKTHSTYKAS